MRHINHIMLLGICLSLTLTACTDDEEHSIPQMKNYSEGYLKSCLGGNGWKCVESHEVKSDGTFEKKDYFDGIYQEAPKEYFFALDTIYTYTTLEDYPLNGYTKGVFSFNEQTNQLFSDSIEIFKVLTIDETTLKLLKYNGIDGNGTKSYLYMIYHKMSPMDLLEYKSKYTFNLDSLEINYPLLPEKKILLEEDFIHMASGKGWKFLKAHKLMWGKRYKKEEFDFNPNTTKYKPKDYIISESSIAILSDDTLNPQKPIKKDYTYRANSSSIVCQNHTEFYLNSISDDTMEIIIDLPQYMHKENIKLFCIYKRMTPREMKTFFQGF